MRSNAEFQSRRVMAVMFVIALTLTNCSRAQPKPNAAEPNAAEPNAAEPNAASPITPLGTGPSVDHIPGPATDGSAARPATAQPRVAGAAQPVKTCKTAADCAAGQACLFDKDGCDSQGFCGEANLVSARNCAVAVPLCGCTSHKTFYGPGGCPGASPEPWTLYGCTCTTDADCGGGQHCVAVTSTPHRPGATLQCQP